MGQSGNIWDRERTRGAIGLAILGVVIAVFLYLVTPRLRYISEYEALTMLEDKLDLMDTIFVFDPNTVTYEELRQLGFAKDVAVGLVKFRANGKVFEIVEDFAYCFGVTDSMYRHFKPYIVIGEEFAAKPKERIDRSARRRDSLEAQRKARFAPRPFEPFRIDTVNVDYLRLIGFSTRQARALIEYRDREAEGIRDMNELRDCYAVSEEMADSLAHFIIFPEPKPYGGKIEINSADSTQLRSVRGIGAKSVVAIMEYRKLLGGFHSIEQIAELKCVTSENFTLISKQICCNNSLISKIDINFATALELERHPYITRKALKQIVELRESKGGWKSIEEMMCDKIFEPEQAKAIAPYLHFGEIPLNFD